MKASELVEKLNALIAEYGDFDGYYLDEYDGWHNIRCVRKHEEEDAFVFDQLPS